MTLKRKQVDLRASTLMTLLCIVWGVQQVAIKGVADEISPVLQIAIRSGVAAGLILILLIARKSSNNKLSSCLLPGLTVGVLFGLQFLFVGEGLRYTSASHMVFFCTPPPYSQL